MTTYFERTTLPQNPHADASALRLGPAPEQAAATLILLHGRGSSAESMLPVYQALQLPDVALVAPQANGGTWYPQSFLAPLADNQPYLDSALGLLERTVTQLLAQGISESRIAILGFSQGACLASEFVARYPRAYGGLMALTGGLIGPPGKLPDYSGSLQGTRVFLGTSDPDAHVPFSRVQETQQVFTHMGAEVELRRYAGMSHTINSDEISACRVLMQRLMASDAPRSR